MSEELEIKYTPDFHRILLLKKHIFKLKEYTIFATSVCVNSVEELDDVLNGILANPEVTVYLCDDPINYITEKNEYRLYVRMAATLRGKPYPVWIV